MSAWLEWDGEILRVGPMGGPALLLTTHWSWWPTFYSDETGWDVAFLGVNIGWWYRTIDAASRGQWIDGPHA